MDNGTSPRKRKKPDRYGDSSKNMDDMLDAIDQSPTSNNNNNKDKDKDYVDLSESSSDVLNSEAIEKNTFEENGSQKSLGRHLARFEAKINQMHLLLIQIQRACISNATTSLLDLDHIDELPLVSQDMLNKFESDLSQDSYRQKIVSTFN